MRRDTRPRRTVPCTGSSPRRIEPEICSGPAHSVDSRPPSLARAAITPPRAVAASRESTRYRLDLPLPLPPVTTVRSRSGTYTDRSERYPSTAMQRITAPVNSPSPTGPRCRPSGIGRITPPRSASTSDARSPAGIHGQAHHDGVALVEFLRPAHGVLHGHDV